MADDLAEGPAIAETTPDTSTTEAEAKVDEAGSGSAPDSVKATEPARDRVQERFDKLTREKYNALRRADQLEYRLGELETKLGKLAKPEQVAPVPPTQEAYQYDDAKYQQAVIEYGKSVAAQTAREATRAEMESMRAQDAQQANIAKFNARQVEFIKSTPDYVEKVMEDRSLPISSSMAEAIRASELGPQIAYYLADNHAKAVDIAGMSPIAAGLELGRIEAMLTNRKATPSVSKAPPPAPKLEASEPALEKSPSDMTDKEFAKWRKKQIEQRR